MPPCLAETSLDLATTLVTIVAPLFFVPLSMITFYVKAMRDTLATMQDNLQQRQQELESQCHRLRDAIAHTERDYATREEWLREAMWARRGIEHIKAEVVRLATLRKRRSRS